jgi:hypothetical protein
VFPGIDHFIVAKGDRVRIRVGNLTMTNHPIHLHGYDFKVTCTDGGWVPEAARWPEVTVDLAVGQMRAIEFKADEPGDWAIHCHKSHHTMNAMGHEVKNFIGVQKRDIAKAIRRMVPEYMPMGSRGMAEMGEMEMPLPNNTLPMMTGFGQFGNDYKDPGWYKHPAGTVAFEFNGPMPSEPKRPAEAPAKPGKRDVEVKVVKPGTRPGVKNHH